MEINLLTLLIMIILGIILNFVILKLLTEKVYPPGLFAGKQGRVGLKGDRGYKGRLQLQSKG